MNVLLERLYLNAKRYNASLHSYYKDVPLREKNLDRAMRDIRDASRRWCTARGGACGISGSQHIVVLGILRYIIAISTVVSW